MFQKTTFLIIAIICISASALHAQMTKKASKVLTERHRADFEADSKIKWINYYQAYETVNNQTVLKTFNPDKLILTAFETYKGKSRTKRNGPYKEYFDNTNVWIEGAYKNDKKSGTWKYYDYETGTVEQYGNFEKGLEQGQWHELDSKGRIESKYNYKNAKLDGELLRYDTTGVVYQRVLYSSGIEIENEILDSLAYEELFDQIDRMPSLGDCAELTEDEEKKCRDAAYLDHVYGGIKYPEAAREYGIEGKASFKFLINKEGELEDIKVFRGVCSDIEKECLRIIKNLPKWTPGLKNGKPIKVSFIMPINFKLE